MIKNKEQMQEQTGYAYALREIIKVQKELIKELKDNILRLEVELVEIKKVYVRPKNKRVKFYVRKKSK